MAEKILTNQADRSLVNEGNLSLGEDITLAALRGGHGGSVRDHTHPEPALTKGE